VQLKSAFWGALRRVSAYADVVWSAQADQALAGGPERLFRPIKIGLLGRAAPGVSLR